MRIRLIRDRQRIELLASLLVPGDIVLFQRGDRIPADVRILECVDLEIDESTLTGETNPVTKHIQAIVEFGAEIPLVERRNIAFMGSLVQNGDFLIYFLKS